MARISRRITLRQNTVNCINLKEMKMLITLSLILHLNENSFSYERLCIKPRFDNEAQSNSEMDYLTVSLSFCQGYSIFYTQWPYEHDNFV